jgi:hypothetical protein
LPVATKSNSTLKQSLENNKSMPFLRIFHGATKNLYNENFIAKIFLQLAPLCPLSVEI